MNPILPDKYYIPDVEAHTDADGRIYLYGSKDIGGNNEYCSYEYQFFSSSNMKEFQEYPIAFYSDRDSEYSAHRREPLYAPDCLKINGKYHLFYCLADGSEGTAVSESPTGPFYDAEPIRGADGTGIDPAVFVDDDGSVYYYWGQIHAKGCRLNSDLKSIEEGTLTENILTEEEHGFHEGISIRKRNGLYYLVYSDISRGRPTCLGYAVSRNPLGPFKKGGIIIDNTGCDPKSWNNHGSIEEFNGQWYVFYHRSSHNSFFSRRVCAEKIYFDENGGIPEVKMTTQGPEEAIECPVVLGAERICQMEGQCYLDHCEKSDQEYLYLTNIYSENKVYFRYLMFSSNYVEVEIVAASVNGKGLIEIYSSQKEESIGSVSIEETQSLSDYHSFKTDIAVEPGVQEICLKFIKNQECMMNFKSIQLKEYGE